MIMGVVFPDGAAASGPPSASPAPPTIAFEVYGDDGRPLKEGSLHQGQPKSSDPCGESPCTLDPVPGDVEERWPLCPMNWNAWIRFETGRGRWAIEIFGHSATQGMYAHYHSSRPSDLCRYRVEVRPLAGNSWVDKFRVSSESFVTVLGWGCISP